MIVDLQEKLKGLTAALLARTNQADEASMTPSFPLDCLPPVFSNYISELVPAGFCPNYLAGGALFTASVAVGNAQKIQVRPTDKPLNVSLFIALIGASASGKSPALDKMIEPLQEKDKASFRAYKSSAGETEDENDGPVPLLISNATFESLVKELSRASGGAGLFTDELISFVQSANQYRKGADLANYLTLLDGRAYHCSRKTQKRIYVENPFLSIVGGLQPIRLPQFYDASSLESGFFYRAINVYGGVPLSPFNVHIPNDTTAEIEYNTTITNLCEFRNQSPAVWTYETAALNVFKEYYDDIARRDKAGEIDDVERIIRTKTNLLFHKFALIFELLNRISTGKVVNDNPAYNPSVSEKAAQAALIFVDYTVSTALFTRKTLRDKATDEIKRPSQIDKAAILYELLPASFTTLEAIEIGVRIGISRETVKRYLKEETKYKKDGRGKSSKI